MSEPSVRARLLSALSLGFELIAIVILFVYAGRYFDAKFEWPGWGMTAGSVLALVVWLTHVVMVMKNIERAAEAEERQKKQ